MTWGELADVMQALQGAGIILLIIMGIGAWRQKQDASPSALTQRLEACRAQCDRDLSQVRADMTTFARKDTIGETLRGMDIRLANIERALRLRPDLSHEE